MCITHCLSPLVSHYANALTVRSGDRDCSDSLAQRRMAEAWHRVRHIVGSQSFGVE